MVFISCWLAHALCAVQFFCFSLFSFSFSFFAPACCNTTEWKICRARQRSVGGVCRTLRNERSAPVQNAHTSFVLKLNKKPFSNFLLSNFVFLYFFATLEAFALTASRSLRASRAGQSARAMRDFIIPQFFIHLFFNVCTP